MFKTQQPTLPVAINDCHQLLAWIVPQLDNFPRARRFTLGEQLALLRLFPSSSLGMQFTKLLLRALQKYRNVLGPQTILEAGAWEQAENRSKKTCFFTPTIQEEQAR